jgi:formate dehydrogenase subunit gamma
MTTHSHWDEAFAKSLIADHLHLEGAMLPILHALQNEFGYVDEAAIPLLADALNISKAEVFGTISFYHDFRHAPAGHRIIKLCRAEACQALGCQSLVEHAQTQHNLSMDTTSADGAVTLETVYCLGNCALGPAALIDGELVGRLNPEKLSQYIDGAGSKSGVKA